jgi:hypothetical protein
MPHLKESVLVRDLPHARFFAVLPAIRFQCDLSEATRFNDNTANEAAAEEAD